MAKVTESIDVNVPVRTAYDQWTQFESFPQFMGGVQQVTQLSDTRLHWKAEIAGRTKEWDAEITEQTPDQRVAWTSTSGARNAGVVSFQSLGADSCRVQLQMDVEPEGPLESAGASLGLLQRTVKDDLEKFKGFIESRGQETGAWRGQVRGGQTTDASSGSYGGSASSSGSSYGATTRAPRRAPPASAPAGRAPDTATTRPRAVTDEHEHVTAGIVPHLREEPPPGSVPGVGDLAGDPGLVSPTDVGPRGVGGLGAEQAGGMPNGFAGATRGPAGTAFPREGVPGADGTAEGNSEADEEDGRTA